MADKPTTLRLPAELAADVEFMARVEGTSASDFIREAIRVRIADRRLDPQFRERLRERVEADQEILRRLADD